MYIDIHWYIDKWKFSIYHWQWIQLCLIKYVNKLPINSNIKENDYNLNLQRSKVPLDKSKSKTSAMSYEAVPLNFVTAEPFELTTIVADRFPCSHAIIGANIGQYSQSTLNAQVAEWQTAAQFFQDTRKYSQLMRLLMIAHIVNIILLF